MQRLRIRYLVNPVNRGYGFSVNRSIVESSGERLLLLNDDARPQPDLLQECDDAPGEGSACRLCRLPCHRAGVPASGEGIGRIAENGDVIGNFDVDCGEPIEVEHIYGFCYVFTREAVTRAGLNDCTLLAQPVQQRQSHRDRSLPHDPGARAQE